MNCNWSTVCEYARLYLDSLRYVFNAEMIFWAAVSTVGVYFSCDHSNNIHQLVTSTWLLAYIFCSLVCGVTIANQQAQLVEMQEMQEMKHGFELIADALEEEKPEKAEE